MEASYRPWRRWLCHGARDDRRPRAFTLSTACLSRGETRDTLQRGLHRRVIDIHTHLVAAEGI